MGRVQEVTDSMLQKKALEGVQAELQAIAATAQASHETIQGLISSLRKRNVISMGDSSVADDESSPTDTIWVAPACAGAFEA